MEKQNRGRIQICSPAVCDSLENALASIFRSPRSSSEMEKQN
ncbi:uncharacterized protein G2W53_011883 [Senna tora]|uniref:Uncharacterized protein n=1 Tax=Senna tora TaxID=362788 RepID=A0A834WN46_9FABA|nr:uncharacterized protein G2W53_011883 [Senna tora]